MNGRRDVVVVGARVAGAATAMLLARAGLRVALLDRSRYGSDTVSTHGLMRAGVLQLSRWGLLDEVVAAGTPAVRRTVFHYAGADPVTVTIRPSVGVDALYAPRRHVLDRVLVDAAVRAGVEVAHDTAVTGLLRGDDGRVRGVRGTGASGGGFELEADLTVGADGIRSLVAREAAAPVVRQGRSASAVLYRYHSELSSAGYEWAYGSASGAGLIPTNDGHTCVFVATTPERMRALRRDGADPAFGRLLAEAGPLLASRVREAPTVDRMHGWGGVPGFVRRPYGVGWALVGDAGYFKDPITTHGITNALRDAELLADAVLAAQAGVLPEPEALASYQATRDRLSHRLFVATDAVAAYDWDTPTVQRRLREVSSAMSDEVDHLTARTQTSPLVAYDWDTPTVQRRLREVSSAMSDEVDHLTARTQTSPLVAPFRGQ